MSQSSSPPEATLQPLVDAMLASYRSDARAHHINKRFLPSRDEAIEIVALLLQLFYPGYFGRQDLTAHVNLTALQQAGESAGMKTEGVFAQGEFLTRIARTTWRDKSGLDEWTRARTRQFQTLTHPEHLEGKFKVLIQTR